MSDQPKENLASNATSTEGPAGDPPRRTQPQIAVDESGVVACYANFCRVSSTPEELILDLALNPQPTSMGPTTVRVSQRIVMNHYTAKRLATLSMALQQYEQTFGVLETDVHKRMRPGK